MGMTDSEKLTLILSKFDQMENRFDRMESRLDQIESRLDQMENRLGELEKEIKDIKLILENEIRVNIRRVAEGHLDLSRNLHEAMKIDSEKEMLSVRVCVLETELRRIKQHLDIA